MSEITASYRSGFSLEDECASNRHLIGLNPSNFMITPDACPLHFEQLPGNSWSKRSRDKFQIVMNVCEQFCRKYSILTTDISFKFSIVDKIIHTEEDIDVQFSTARSPVSEKAALNIIEVPALHPIATEKEWSNSNSIHTYDPEEFISRIVNVHDKDSTSVYNALLVFREGSNLKKTTENQISIAELLSLPDKDGRIERLYHELRKMLDPPAELSLPYTKTKKRADALVARIAKLYDIDKEKEPSYKLVRGFYKDKNGIGQYPFVFEIIAIPFKNPIGPPVKSTEIIRRLITQFPPERILLTGIIFGMIRMEIPIGRKIFANSLNSMVFIHIPDRHRGYQAL